jgi:tyrosine-protein kinase Etk/Wzc
MVNRLPQNGGNTEDGVHFFDILVVLARHKKLVIATPIIVGTLAMIVSCLLTPIFTSTAKIMPPAQQQSSGVAAMLGQLGGLAGAAGGIGGLKSPNDLYVGLLESRTVADNLISRWKLQERYEQKTLDDTRRQLAANTAITEVKKGGFITISVTDKEPKFAAELANAYVDELANLTQTIAITEASQRRLFFERQLEETRVKLAKAELALRSTQESTGMVRPEAQVQAIITTVAQVKGTIAAKEVQLQSMRTFATGQNPDLVRVQEELRSLQSQLVKLEKSQPSRAGDFMVPVGKIPEVGVAYVRSVRDVKYYENIFELLAKQFELAKIDEAKDSTSVQLLDKALPAERKSKPSRVLITLAGAFFGAILGITLAFLRESASNPEARMKWRKVASAWNGAAGGDGP